MDAYVKLDTRKDFGHYTQPFKLLESADIIRLEAERCLDSKTQAHLGQFFTPTSIAKHLASLFRAEHTTIHLLEPGAGTGMLTAAFVEEICSRNLPPKTINITAYEIDPNLCVHLRETLEFCKRRCEVSGMDFSYQIIQEDFIENVVHRLKNDLFSHLQTFTSIILNPPYKKIGVLSKERLLLQQIGVETVNLYTGFLSLAVKLLQPEGELVAITPRSFCNGLYFKSFRREFLREMSLRNIYTFENRKKSFDNVLQENLIIRAVKSQVKPEAISIVALASPNDDLPTVQILTYNEVIHPNDPESFIRIVTNSAATQIVNLMHQFTYSLDELGIKVSTGKVVDFRARNALRLFPEQHTVPLLYPHNLISGYAEWLVSKNNKPQAIIVGDKTKPLLSPKGNYVLVRRFSAKEEKRRIVAALYDPKKIVSEFVGFENHLNFFHEDGHGLPEGLARGLTLFLNSTMVDQYFRQFNGHTQVNATDLRTLNYPSREQLERLGKNALTPFPKQIEIDTMLTTMLPKDETGFDPIQIKQKIDEAMFILAAIGLPKAQLNERSSLTLLALLRLEPSTSWATATDPLMGITPMMDFMAQHYGRRYKPNTRETVRRQTMHQFVDAGIAIQNPDDPKRPPNSPKWVYQVEPSALELFRTFGTNEWSKSLETFLASFETLREKYAQKREMERIPVRFNDTIEITLSPGGQNELIKEIINQFCPRFVPGGHVIYIGDTDEKWLYFDQDKLKELGVIIESHGKMPDVVIHHTQKGWLLLVEAVTSHGPINPKRLSELSKLFEKSSAGLVYVTAFLTRKAMLEYFRDIAWETEVWIAESPEHMIHFDGERFLGPYEKDS
jgi:adenine-specific DNA-methyltransferase